MKRQQATASYRVVADAGANRYSFFCPLSGAIMCTTNPIRAAVPEEELQLAWQQEGKQHFNLCHKCGRWVSSIMFNADVLLCVDCAPWEEPPHFCRKCGAKAPGSGTVCTECGAQLRYGEVVLYGD